MTRAEVAADKQNRTAQEAQPAPVQQDLPDLLSGKSLDDIIAERLKNKSAAQPAVSSSHSPRARAQLSAPAKTALRTAATQRALEELETQQNRLNRQRRALLWSQRTGNSPEEYQTSDDEDENPDRQHQVEQDAAYAHKLHQQEQQEAQQFADAAAEQSAKNQAYAQALSLSGRRRRVAQPAVLEPKPAEKPAARKHNKPAAQPAAEPVAQPATKPTAQPAANKPKKPRRKSPTPSLGSQDELLDYGDGDQDMPQAPMGDSEEPSGSPGSSSSGKAAPAESAPGPEPLTAKNRTKISKSLKYIIYSTYDDWACRQDNLPAAWLDSLEHDLKLNDIEPDHVVSLLKDSHLGANTACTMASWMASNRSASWRDFRAAFLQRHPSKPPTVTRHTWKALNMHNQGTYHAFLTEFNRQKALIPTGPDEVLEAFLKGLSPALRSQVEFYKNRLWKPSEFDKLVSITTERVNSSVISHPDTQTKPETRIRSHSQGSRLQANPSKRSFSAGPRQGPKPGIKPARHSQPGTTSRSPGFIGRNPTESKAISQYCFENRLCKYCRSADHRSSDCSHISNPLPFLPHPGWNERLWVDKSDASSLARLAKRPKN